MKNHYVSNKELFIACKAYSNAYKQSKLDGIETPPVPEDIGHAILQISTRLMNNHNFVGYSFKDEMIADAVYKCIKKVHNFDPEKSDNPFAFLSQISWNSAIERIKIERRQTSIKAKMVNEKLSSDFVMHGGMQDDPDFSNAFVEFLKDNEVLVDHYATTKDDKKFKVHDSLVHRNKTAYTKTVKVEDEAFDLTEFGI
jgi:DNA-directed RNA polymerase specialized sigma24 family protein